MYRFMPHIRRLQPGFLRREDGTATIEAVLWMPIFLAVFALMVDASMVFHGQSKVLRIIQDANRNMSIGRFTTDTQVETYINNELAQFGVVPTLTNAQSGNGAVLTLVRVPARQLQILGLFSSLLDLQIDVSSVHILDSASPDDFTTMVPTS